MNVILTVLPTNCAKCCLGASGGGHHFPSDVLAGADLGNFLSSFITMPLWVVPKQKDLNWLFSAEGAR